MMERRAMLRNSHGHVGPNIYKWSPMAIWNGAPTYILQKTLFLWALYSFFFFLTSNSWLPFAKAETQSINIQGTPSNVHDAEATAGGAPQSLPPWESRSCGEDLLHYREVDHRSPNPCNVKPQASMMPKINEIKKRGIHISDSEGDQFKWNTKRTTAGVSGMIICGKKNGSPAAIFSFLFILTLCFLSYYWKKSGDWYPLNGNTRKEKLRSHSCKGQGYLTNATITPLRDKNSFIIAPYYDKRDGNFIRVLSIVHHEKVKELYCMFCCQNSSVTRIVKAEIDIHPDRFEFPYGTADLLCLEPQDCDSQFISVHPSADPKTTQLPLFQIQNLDSESPSLEFTVCISTMFGGYNNVLQFIQSVEMYKILGAQKVMIYKNSCSPLLEKVLDYYISEGTVEIIPWPIHLHLKVSSYWHHSKDISKDIGYYGQITALNDCIYHNMYRSKYVVLIDADEMILPIKDADWKSLMQRLEKENPNDGIFLFENHVYGNSLFSTVPFNFSSWDAVPGENILEYVYRQPRYLPAVKNKKMMINPRKVVQTSVHNIVKKYGKSVCVKSSIAILFHCKKPMSENLGQEPIVPNKILWRYSSSLIPNVNEVLHKSNIL